MMTSTAVRCVPIALTFFALACGGSTETNAGGGGSAGAGGSTGGGSAGAPGTTIGPGTGTGGPGTGAGGAGAGMGGAAGSGDSGTAPSESIAMLVSQVPPDQIPSDRGSDSWLDMGEHLDPTTLLIAVASQGLFCAAPHLKWSLGAPSHAFILVGLPQAMQKPGTYAFSSTDIIAWGSVWIGDGAGGGGANRALQMGSIEILDIDASSVHFSLSDLPSEFTSLKGARTTLRCP